MSYQNPQGVKIAFSELSGLEPGQVFFTDYPFELSPPPGVDWADYEDQPDLEIPQPDDEEGNPVPSLFQPQPPIRRPRPVWDWYHQQYSGLAPEPPTPEQVAAWAPPEPEPIPPVTDVERMAGLFAQAQAGAPAYLNQLKGAVWVALVTGGMSEAEATAAGVALVLRHAAPLAAFEAAGGHPVAAAALYDAISSAESMAALPWLTAPILAIFQAALKPG